MSLAIVLQPGFPVGELKSPYHEIDVRQEAEDHYRISLREGPVPADRDFELVWTPAKGAEPTAAVFSESTASEHYVMAMVMPPTLEAAASRIAREVIFVIDTSGSMEGPSIEQARRALALAIDRLDGGDRFNVIAFDDQTFALFDQPQPADDDKRARAKQAVERLDASGGTEMAPAIELALSGQAPRGFLRQVVFITDGAVGNERELFRIVRQRLGPSRLFTVGIGSAPNSYFMVEAAAIGRGTYTTIGSVSQVGERMSELFSKLERPILSDLRADWPAGVVLEASSDMLPDLYAGEPVVLTAKISNLRGHLSIRGCLGAQPWQATLPLGEPSQVGGVAKLWARDRIDDLMTAMIDGRDLQGTRKQIVALALGHGLVTEYTSLIAIDDTPARPGEENLTSRNVPINLPDGWNPDRVFGPLQPPNAGIQSRLVLDPTVVAPDVAGQPDPSAAFEVDMAVAEAVALPPPPVLNTAPPLQTQTRIAGPTSPRTSADDNARSGIWIPALEIDMSQPARAADAGLSCG